MYPFLALICFALSLLLPLRPVAQTTARPNIVFILTDDQRADALGYAGNALIRTPEMDRLAAEGVYFHNAFVTTPICAASRASIITGTYERTHGYTFQQPPLPPARIAESYFTLTRKAGYHTGFLGKLGVSFENQLDTTLFDVYQPERTGFYWRLNADGTQQVHLTDLMGQRAVAFIENAPDDRPFCLSISFNAPHAEDLYPGQYLWPSDLDSLYEEVDIPDPQLGEDIYFQRQPEFVQKGYNRARWHWRYDSPEKYQHSVKGYYRMISAVDRCIGMVRRALEAKGLEGNTVILFSSDNGLFLGERQLAGKWLLYDLSLRVPLILLDPRVERHREVRDIALNVDIPATILDLAGIPLPSSYEGKSLLGYTRGETPLSDRASFLCEHLWEFAFIPPSEGIRTRKWKYFRYRHHPEHRELYDLEADPEEIHNLIDLDEYKPVTEQLERELQDLIRSRN